MAERKAPTPVDPNQIKPEPPPAPPSPLEFWTREYRQRPCGFPLCPAIALDGHEHCPVHSPDKVIERVKAIVECRLKEVLEAGFVFFDDRDAVVTNGLLKQLRHDILTDLKVTV